MVQEHPILLYGFDFPTQNKLRFDHVWSAAFLTPKYTNEDHEELRACYWGEKKREIKYGNNIAVLFWTMLRLARTCGQLQEGFWRAIARGFNTNTQAVMETAKILIDARKTQRSKPSKDVSETARAVDRWIDFMDSRGRDKVNQLLLPSQQVTLVLDYLRDLEGRQVNAAGIPLNPNIRGAASFTANGRRLSSPGYYDDPGPAMRGPPPLSIKTEPRGSPDRIDRIPTGPRSARKRSASPIPAAFSPTTKRPNLDLGNLRSPRDQQPTGSDEVLPRTLGAHVILPPHSSEAPPKTAANGVPNPPRQPLEGAGAVLIERADELKTKLVKPEGHIQTLTAIKDVSVVVSDVNEEVRGMRAVMEVMMDSMHAVADNLNAIKDDILGLRAQQNGPNPGAFPESLAGIIKPIQALSEDFNLLRKEVANLKNQPPPPPPPAPQFVNELRELVQEQSTRITSLNNELMRIQYKLGPPGVSGEPQSLRQALAAAEHDLRHHLHTVQNFYNSSNKNLSRVSADSTEDLIYALQQGLKSAQGGLQA